jgi:hypothetical protein
MVLNAEVENEVDFDGTFSPWGIFGVASQESFVRRRWSLSCLIHICHSLFFLLH